ncbi:MAG: hypothetical protein KKF39_02155 [Nanoarchaeota archaeon]|nr:hypothetical protein [Nanoarchaeota archaeon]
MGSRIRSVGIYFPKRELGNFELERILAASGQETSNEWMIQRTGITKRRIARKDETPGTMAVQAARDALERLKRDIPPIGHIVVASNSAERMFPNIAGLVQDELIKSHSGMIDHNAAGSDPHAGCGGINIAVMYADALVSSGFYETVLAIGTEKLSAITDYSDRGTCVLFGDGAIAYAVTRNKGRGGFVGHEARGKGVDREVISCEENMEKVTFEEAVRAVEEVRAPVKTRGRVLLMDGRAVYKYVEKEWLQLIKGFKDNRKLNPNGIAFSELAFISPHLANLRMLTALERGNPGFLRKCGLSSDGENEYFFNNSTASQGRRDRQFLKNARPGDHLLKFGYGAELCSCANLYQMPED